MNSSVTLPLFFLFLPITAACLLNDTHCTCTSTPPGGSCLRYVSTSANTNYCSSYTCHAGTVCDCMGTDLCTISRCPSSRRIYRPIPAVPVNTRGLTPCKLASHAICINPLRDQYGQALPAPSPEFIPYPSTSVLPSPSPSFSPSISASSTPTPAPSVSATSSPSVSMTPTPSATPSVSLSTSPSMSTSSTPSASATLSLSPSPSPPVSSTPTPSASATPPPTPSRTPTPSPSTKPSPSPSSTNSPIPSPSTSAAPSLTPLPIGSYCEPSFAPCEQGSVCSCKGMCSEIVKMDIAALSDNTARIFVCDKQVGKSVGWTDIARFSYTGACDDIIVENENTAEHYARIALAIDHENQIYSTGFGMDVIVKKDAEAGYLTNPFYDYSKWSAPVSMSASFTDKETAALNEMQDEYAALPIGPKIGPNPVGVYTYKLAMPFCQYHSDISQF